MFGKTWLQNPDFPYYRLHFRMVAVYWYGIHNTEADALGKTNERQKGAPGSSVRSFVFII